MSVAPFYAPENSTQFHTPDAGLYPAVCADLVDLGIQPGFEGKPTHQCELAFQLVELDPDGKRFQVQKTFTVSMNEKANLRKFIKSWRGKDFDKGEAGAFNLATLIGQPCMLSLSHKVSQKGNTYAVIDAITPLMKGMPRPVIENYKRRERTKAAQPGAPAVQFPAAQDDDEVPF